MELIQRFTLKTLNSYLIILCVFATLYFVSLPTAAYAEQKEVNYYESNNVTNEIPYFDNRFEIDADLEEITLLFYRKRGSTPVILVQPDGSKIRVNGFDPKKIEWFDDRTFDMIKIKKPMPGPWQVIGEVLPKSQILVVSDVTIAVEPLPNIVFSGETLKVAGELFNGEKAIDSPKFREVVKLDVHFYSTNNSAYDNFGADAIKIASFLDDGRDLDEYAGDNIFTGEFVLDFSAGEWQPVYLVKLPMVTRELRQQPVILYKTPITIDVVASDNESTPHKMTLMIDPSYVDPDSLVFQGKITFPDRQVEPFSIMDETGTSRLKDINYTEAGIYRINVSAFGKTVNGREFRLVVPEFSFNALGEMNVITPLSEDGIISETSYDQPVSVAVKSINIEEALAKAKIEQEQINEEKNQQMILMITVGNAVIILIALLAFGLMKKRKRSK